MRLSEQLRRSHTILRVEGNLKVGETADAFRSRIDGIASKGGGALVLDLEALDYIDSTGVGVLVGALKVFQAAGRQILLAAPQRRVHTEHRGCCRPLSIGGRRPRRGSASWVGLQLGPVRAVRTGPLVRFGYCASSR